MKTQRSGGMMAAGLVAAAAVFGLAQAARAATVTWNGTGDRIWTQPDDNSFSATYNSGGTVVYEANRILFVLPPDSTLIAIR